MRKNDEEEAGRIRVDEKEEEERTIEKYGRMRRKDEEEAERIRVNEKEEGRTRK